MLSGSGLRRGKGAVKSYLSVIEYNKKYFSPHYKGRAFLFPKKCSGLFTPLRVSPIMLSDELFSAETMNYLQG